MSARREPRAPKKSSAKAAAKSAPARDLFGTPSTAGAFSLRDMSVPNVQRAQELAYHDNFEKFKSFHNFFASYNDEMYREIDTKHAMKREAMVAWIAETFGPDVQLRVNNKPNGKENKKGKVLELLVVAAALTMYDEDHLLLRFKLGEIESLVTNHYRSTALRSKKQQERRLTSTPPHLDKKQVAHTLGLGFVKTLVRNLPAEKRVNDEHLQVSLNRDYWLEQGTDVKWR